jgi:16S rRNA U516 pseudouridylate synthase RsuA-like enzyme
LRRTRIGSINLGNLPVGRLRPLTSAETEQIRNSA